MKRIILLALLLILLTGFSYYLLSDVSFTAIMLFAGFLAIGCYSVNQHAPAILDTHELHVHAETLGKETIAETLNGYDLKTVSQLRNFPNINSYFETNIRHHDSDEYIEEMKKSLLFASIIYIFSTIYYIIHYSLKVNPAPEIVVETGAAIEHAAKNLPVKDTASKSHYAYIYLACIAAYTFWYVSPIMLFKKKNKFAKGH